ncbi:neurotrypsin-like [Amphiura filiformis]|uniref:neurotrypsin-like n=1 Tax=Amphiura filiformis TaxID=82378 RepID=UPI003B216A3F
MAPRTKTISYWSAQATESLRHESNFITFYMFPNPYSIIPDISDVRLADDAFSYGRLEVYWNDDWRPVCNNVDLYGSVVRQWNHQAAWVACRQLGYQGGRALYYEGLSVETTSKVYNVQCGYGPRGYDKDILKDCDYEVGAVDCKDNRQAGVACFNVDDIYITRYGDEPIWNGRIGVLTYKEWRPVCQNVVYGTDDTEWNHQAAWVACRQLGYQGGKATSYPGFSVHSERKVFDVQCGDGLYDDLKDCESIKLENVDCDGDLQAGVSCFDDIDIGFNNDRTNEGNVEIKVQDEWHAVCYHTGYISDFVWNVRAALLACRRFGFVSGTPLALDGLSTSGYLVNDVRCPYGAYKTLVPH